MENVLSKLFGDQQRHIFTDYWNSKIVYLKGGVTEIQVNLTAQWCLFILKNWIASVIPWTLLGQRLGDGTKEDDVAWFSILNTVSLVT